MRPLVWDEPKRLRNLRRPPDGHGLDFAEARERFEWDSAVIVPTKPSSRGGDRHMVIGFLDGELVTLIFSLLAKEAISAISLRRASRKEKRAYDEA